MSLVWTKHGTYRLAAYESEADLETAINQVKSELFGENRIYLDVKKKIGAKAGLRNIPDGYLIDLSGQKPRLYVVENELASHEPLRHIAVQILEFSLSFEAEPRAVRKILFNALQEQPEAVRKCEAYAASHNFRNLDHFLDTLVFETPFAALVVIDEIPENLENVLAKKFQFGVEVLELACYENGNGEKVFRFEPFLADFEVEPVSPAEAPVGTVTRSRVDASTVDTVVVPAREEGFQDVFIKENRWYAVRIHGTMRPQIKYVAAYRVAPVSAITHIAPVRTIEPWKDSEKFVINFAEPAKEIGPIPLVKGSKGKALQNLRYTNRQTIEQAKTLCSKTNRRNLMSLKDYVTLGRSGSRVRPLTLGTMTFGTEWGWGAEENTSRDVFNRYIDAGGNFIDTADLYTGTSEKMVGKFITERSLRDRVVLATKFTFNAEPGNPNAGGNGRKNIYRALESSLKRLQTDYIDLYRRERVRYIPKVASG